jgi:hypothetical protein
VSNSAPTVSNDDSTVIYNKVLLYDAFFKYNEVFLGNQLCQYGMSFHHFGESNHTDMTDSLRKLHFLQLLQKL